MSGPPARFVKEIDGVALPIQLELLIEEMAKSPRMQRRQVDIFRGLLECLEFRRRVHQSSLLASPFQTSERATLHCWMC